mgnify:CR=1 FL=1
MDVIAVYLKCCVMLPLCFEGWFHEIFDGLFMYNVISHTRWYAVAVHHWILHNHKIMDNNLPVFTSPFSSYRPGWFSLYGHSSSIICVLFLFCREFRWNCRYIQTAGEWPPNQSSECFLFLSLQSRNLRKKPRNPHSLVLKWDQTFHHYSPMIIMPLYKWVAEFTHYVHWCVFTDKLPLELI